MKAAGRALLGRERFPWPDMHMANVGGVMFSRFNRLWKGPPAPGDG